MGTAARGGTGTVDGERPCDGNGKPCALLMRDSRFESERGHGMKQRCSGADKYQAERAPTCGCAACWDRWTAKQRARTRAANERARRMARNQLGEKLQRPKD